MSDQIRKRGEIAEVRVLRAERAANESPVKKAPPVSSHQLVEAQRTVRQLQEELNVRNAELAEYRTNRAHAFVEELRHVKREPRRARKLPVALAHLVVPPAARPILKRTLGPAGIVAERVAEVLIERPLRMLPPTSALLAAARPVAERLGLLAPPRAAWPENQPLVSVIIPCFNYGHFLADALASLDRQTLQDFEIILVEGGSTDGHTLETVRALQHPKVRKIFQPEPTLVGENRLAGLQTARGKYCVFLDADDMLAPTYLEKAALALELTGVDVAYPAVQLVEKENWVWETGDEFTLASLAKHNSVPTVAMFSRESWARLKIGYGTNKDGAIEDWDFWLRFAERGAKGYKIQEPLMLYRIHGNSLSDQVKQRQEAADRATLAPHRRYLGPLRIRRISRGQRVLPKPVSGHNDLSRTVRDDGALGIALAVPWLVVGGSDHLMLQVFADHRERNARLTVYTTLGAPAQMGNSSADYQALSDDVFELHRELPEASRPDAILHLLKTRNIKVLLLVGSAMTYDLLPRLRTELPHVKVIDHLYNAVGHIENNRRHAQRIDFHIVANDEVKDALLARGERSDRIAVVHHGIDMRRYDPVDFRRTDDLPGLALRSGERLVLYAGRFSEEKGVHRVVEFAERMRSDENVRFAMIGDGPMRPAVEEALQRAGLRDRVTLLGFVRDARDYLRRADVVVIPSDVEGLPLVCLESLAMGTPVVASAVGALPAAIENGVTGEVVPPGEVGAFTDAIRRTLRLGAADREALARTCRESVVDRFSIEAVRDQYHSVFRKVAGLAPSVEIQGEV